MNPNEYQQLALRTMADQSDIRLRVIQRGVKATQMDNALRGLMDEVGELAGAIKVWLEYGQPLDSLNIKEEIGDCLWRLAQACDAIGITLEQAMEANIAKLQQRYPDKYSDELAAEENRNRQAERDALGEFVANKTPINPATLYQAQQPERKEEFATEYEQTGHGFAEPPEEVE